MILYNTVHNTKHYFQLITLIPTYYINKLLIASSCNLIFICLHCLLSVVIAWPYETELSQ